MKNINLEFKNILTSFASFNKKIPYVFWLILFLVIFFQFFVVKQTYDLANIAKQEPNFTIKSQGVRINFAEYEKAVERIEQNQNFTPVPKNLKNPFFSR